MCRKQHTNSSEGLETRLLSRVIKYKLFLLFILLCSPLLCWSHVAHSTQAELNHVKTIIQQHHYPTLIEQDMQKLFATLLRATQAERGVVEEVKLTLKPHADADNNLKQLLDNSLPISKMFSNKTGAINALLALENINANHSAFGGFCRICCGHEKVDVF